MTGIWQAPQEDGSFGNVECAGLGGLPGRCSAFGDAEIVAPRTREVENGERARA